MKKLFLLTAMIIACCSFAFAQKSISGKVTNQKTGLPLQGVSVIIKDGGGATQTDENGNFSLANVPANAKIIFSIIGYKNFEGRLGSGNTLDISMDEDSKELAEVVVTALGQTKSKDRIGYATATFKADDVVRSAPVSALDGLQGRVPGADISTVGGQPGSSSKVIVRGYTSFGGNNQALIIVDGVPFNNARLGSFQDFVNAGGADFGNGLNDMNPNDIDNISILKGAAATSLYGSRAANGVVIVTTKKGRAGKVTVDFTSSAIVSSVAKLPDFQNTFGQGWNGQHWKEENGSWGPKLDGKQRLWGSIVDNSRLIKSYSAVKDNVRDFYDPGLELGNNLSVRGGNEGANFYISYGNVNSDGILPGDVDKYQRNTFSARGQIKANRFSVSASMNYINKSGATANTRDDAQGTSTFENIIQIARDIPITDFKDYNNKFFNVDNYFTPYASNPYYSLFENGNKNQNDRVFGNVEFGYDISKVFNVRFKTGLDVGNARVKDWQAVEAPKPNTWRGNPSINAEATGLAADLIGGVRELSDYAKELNSDFLLNYNKDIVSDLNLSGFVGFNYNERETRTHESRVKGLTIPNFYDITNSPNAPTTTTILSKRRLIGAFAQANLAYKDFLFLSLNARNDWSSTLPQGKNSFFYPGANASFLVSRLMDLHSAGISYFKIRTAVGRTGKDAPVYSLQSVGVASTVALGFGNILFPINGLSAYEIGNIIGNLNLKPELTTEYEVGTEIRFLKDRIGVDVAYYNKRTKGQILNVPIAPSTGYLSAVANFGLIENKGIELAFNVSPVKTKDFTWNINYTFTKNKNTVLELPVGLDKVDFNSSYDIKMVARVGYPVGIIEAPTRVKTADGKYVVSANGMFAQSPEDGVYGNVQRDYMMGLNNNLIYKNWSLGFSLDYRKGGVFVSRTADLEYFTGNALLTTYNDRRPFIIPNSVVQTGTDAAGKPVYAENTHAIDMNNFNSYWYHTTNQPLSWENTILPKDFLKLRDVTLSYRLPAGFTHRLGLQGIALSAIARNFLLWVPQKNTFIDPEVTNLGNDLLGEFGEQAGSATTKSYGASLKINF
ncbi:MAG: SusC/RagA family TonB-linked outer membrane protein [Chitinophagaceae bacterium]